MNNVWAFLPMRSSNECLGDANALQERLADDGYLLFKNVIPREDLTSLRRAMLGVLADAEWVRGGNALMKGIATARPVREGDEDFFRAYDAVQCLEEFHTFAHHESLMSIMQQVVGETAFPHPLKIARLSFPGNYEVSTPPHQDYPNNQGTPNLTAAWIPTSDCPIDLGPLAILRGSHRYGVLPLTWHIGAGNRQAVLPEEMLENLRWVTTDLCAGDVILFPSTTVHASLHNATEFHMRVSVDFRYQQEGEELTEICLRPHFDRLDWQQIYANWSSTDYQYYWKDLDYKVVPFEKRPIPPSSKPRPEDIRAGIAFDRRRDARYQRRIERVADISVDDAEAGNTP